MKKNLVFRLENINDRKIVENMVRRSFWNVYRSGAYEHYVLHVMRNDSDFVGELNYIMELDGEIIGQVAFVRSHIKCDDGKTLPTLTLEPICVAQEYKGQGYGKKLLDFAFERAKELGYGGVLFEGNIDFTVSVAVRFALILPFATKKFPKVKIAHFFYVNNL